MKISVNIDCTPEEARTFFGLPDVKPMQDAIMKEVQDRITANLQAMDPETLFKTWLPAQVQNLEQLQNMFWSQLGKATQGKRE